MTSLIAGFKAGYSLYGLGFTFGAGLLGVVAGCCMAIGFMFFTAALRR